LFVLNTLQYISSMATLSSNFNYEHFKLNLLEPPKRAMHSSMVTCSLFKYLGSSPISFNSPMVEKKAASCFLMSHFLMGCPWFDPFLA
jgi:hypothetical protein